MRLSILGAVFFAVASVPAFAAASTIGIATSLVSYSVNDQNLNGLSGIQNGSRVVTTTAPADIRLDNGVQVRMATRSSGTVYSDHISLDKGAVRVGSFADFTVRIQGLEVSSDSPNAQAIVRADHGRVEIASLGGDVKVNDGAMMTHVGSGLKAEFQASATHTGANPADLEKDRNTLFWSFVGVSSAALVIGGIAWYQGKSPW